MQALRDLLKPERLTAIVETGVAEDEAPPYQRMLDEGLCEVRIAGDLSDVRWVGPLDLLKITGTGVPTEVLRAGPDKVAVHASTSFFPTYTFANVDAELRSQGFVAHCFADCFLMPIPSPIAVPHPDPHQLATADLLYVRDFTQPMTVEQWKHLAMLAHHVCGSHDLAMHAVCRLAASDAIASDAGERYRQILVAA